MKFLVLLFSVLAANIQQIYSLQSDSMDTFKTKLNLYDPSWGTLSSGILKSHDGLSYTANRNKTLMLSAPIGYSIFVGIRLLDLRPNQQDSLTLFVNGSTNSFKYSNPWSSRSRKYDPLEEINTFYAPNGQIGVTFYTGPDFYTYGYDGFELIYTVQETGPFCSSFKCGNRRCISIMLTCDGHNHCGDRSDQRNCYLPSYNDNSRLVGSIFGTIFLVIAISCAIFLACRRAAGRRTEVRVLHSPPSNQPVIVSGSYPQHGNGYPPPPPYSQDKQGVTNPVYR